MSFVQISKDQLYKMRHENTCFDILLKEAYYMCKNNGTPFPKNMEDNIGVKMEDCTNYE